MPDEFDIDEDNAIAEFNNAVKANMRGGLDRDAAILAVARRNPELHKAFIRASNAGKAIPKVYDES